MPKKDLTLRAEKKAVQKSPEIEPEPYEPSEAARHLRLLLSRVERQIPLTELQKPTPSIGRRKLTVGMAVYDDYDGVYFTVQALRLYHPEVLDEIEILVIDNHPEGPSAAALKQLDAWIRNFRYVPYRAYRSTAIRDLVFREANADSVICVDSHVLIQPGALRRLIDYFELHPDSQDLLQGPVVYDDLDSISTHFAPGWRDGMYGTWDTDDRGKDPNAEPFEIPMQGLGLFACRRKAWPGFNPRVRGFGVEEGYIHEKIRQAGGRVMCLPFLRWVHRFNRPGGVPYQVSHGDRIRNYLLTFRELGLDESTVEAHFTEHLGPAQAAPLISKAKEEIENPFLYFDAIYCINLSRAADRWRKMEERFEKLGIAWVVRRFEAVGTPENHHIGCALSHRGVVAEAKKLGLRNVLVLEDDAVFHRDTLDCLRNVVSELERTPWELLYLGGHRWGKQFPVAEGCRYLEEPDGLTCTHAIAYHGSFYDRLLSDLPGDLTEMEGWVLKNTAIDQYLMRLDARRLVTRPSLATQPALVRAEAVSERKNYTI